MEFYRMSYWLFEQPMGVEMIRIYSNLVSQTNSINVDTPVDNLNVNNVVQILFLILGQ